MDALAWAWILLFLGFALVLLEMFIPSGGVIGFIAGLSVVTAVVLAFVHGSEYGVGFLALSLIAIPVVIGVALHYWPNTPMGRRVLLNLPRGEDVLPDDEERRGLRELVGRDGQAKTLMLPSGTVLIGGRTVDALSEGVPIEPGQWVRVVEVRGTRVVVRPLDGPPPPAQESAPDGKPLGDLPSEPFEDPFA